MCPAVSSLFNPSGLNIQHLQSHMRNDRVCSLSSRYPNATGVIPCSAVTRPIKMQTAVRFCQVGDGVTSMPHLLGDVTEL